MKRSILLVSMLTLILLLVPITVIAAEDLSGQCGRQMTYSYDENTKVLTVSGKGDPYQDFRFPQDVQNNTKTVLFENYSSETLPPFWNFISLESFSLPESVNRFIFGTTFGGCSSLKSFNFSKTEVYLPNDFFSGCNALETVNLPSNVSFGDSSFKGWTGLKHIEIPDGAKHIGWFCFAYCPNLESITLPQSMVIESDDLYATFKDCGKLKKVELPLNTKRIAYECFMNCSELEEVLIPASVTSIENNAFDYCNKVTIIGAKNSYAEKYATDSGIPFKEHDHNYDDWSTTIDPTCTKNGVREKICIECGNKITEEIPANGHKWNEGYTIDQEATYAKTGIKSIHCSICDAIQEGSETIVPKLTVKATSLSKPTAVKKGFTVKWKKGSDVTGYEIQYAFNNKFTKSKKTVKVKKSGTTSKKISKLKSKKTYYVRIRTYKIFNGKKYCSIWSKPKSVKTK